MFVNMKQSSFWRPVVDYVAKGLWHLVQDGKQGDLDEVCWQVEPFTNLFFNCGAVTFNPNHPRHNEEFDKKLWIF